MVFFLYLISHAHAQDQARNSGSLIITQSKMNSCPESGQYILKELEVAIKGRSLSSNLLRRAPFASFQFHIRRSCIQAAQQQVTAGHWDNKKFVRANDFVTCTQDRKILKTNLMTPCQTNEVVTLTHNSLELVTQCLAEFVSDSSDPLVHKSWIQTYFKLLTKESGLQNHVRSKSRPHAAIGLGQINKYYIEDFEKFAKKSVQEYLSSSRDTNCVNLEKVVFSKPLIGPHAACNFVGYDEDQILRNLVVSFANIKIYRDRINSFLNRNKEKLDLSAHEQKQAEHFLLAWAYNGGSGNIERWIRQGLASERKKIQTSEQLYHAVFKKIDKPEAKAYIGNINKRMQSVREAAQEQSCWAK
ncbi:MAG: hypothetical protein ACK5V3_18470 [Bdellovibrionales bacterium]